MTGQPTERGPLRAVPETPTKQWDETQRPAGFVRYLVLFAVIGVSEVWALATGRTTWTVSAVLWWAAGPRWQLRWWLVWAGVVVPFLGWLIIHAGFREFEGRALAVMMLAGLGLALLGAGVAHLQR